MAVAVACLHRSQTVSPRFKQAPRMINSALKLFLGPPGSGMISAFLSLPSINVNKRKQGGKGSGRRVP